MFQPAASLSHTVCYKAVFTLDSSAWSKPECNSTPSSSFSFSFFFQIVLLGLNRSTNWTQRTKREEVASLMGGFRLSIWASARGFSAGKLGSTCSAFDDCTCCCWCCCWASLSCLSVNAERVQSRSETSAVWRMGREGFYEQRAQVWKEEKRGEEVTGAAMIKGG